MQIKAQIHVGSLQKKKTSKEFVQKNTGFKKRKRNLYRV